MDNDRFRAYSTPQHGGISYYTSGDVVHAVHSGRVVETGCCFFDRGCFVVIQDDQGREHTCYYLEAIEVGLDSIVASGDVIGRIR